MKSYLSILLIGLFACDSTPAGKVHVSLDSITDATLIEAPPRWKNESDTLYVSMNNDAIVLGDSISREISYIAIKYEPHIRFSDFPASMLYNENPATIDFKSHPNAREFRTQIKKTLKEQGVNFAGHYCMVVWGCGSPCQMSVIVDVITGKVYYGEGAGLGYEFQKDSRMLIVNPVGKEVDIFHPKPGYYLDCPYCKPEIHVWNEELKKFEQR